MTTLRTNYFGTSEGNESFNTDSARRRMATFFIAGATYTLERVVVKMQKVGSPTMDITLEIRAISSNRPGTVLGTSTTTISASSLTTSYAEYTFDGLSVALTSGVTYWVALSTSAVGDFSNYIQLSQISAEAFPGYSMLQRSDSVGTTWSDQANLNFELQTYSDLSTVDQEGFRFGADDDSESAHTWLAAQDTNVNVALDTTFLLRTLIDTTGDAAATPYTLRYQKNGAGGYLRVPVGATSSPTLAWGAAGTIAYSTSGGTSVAPTYPSGITTNSGLVLVVGQKPSSANGGTVTTPSGWTLQGSLTGANDGDTGGYTTTLGADTGNCNIFVYTKDSVEGTESGTLSVTVGTNNVCWANIYRIEASDVATWSWQCGTGKDTSAGNVSIATGSMDVAAGDFIVVGMVIPTDVTTPAQFSAQALSQSGTTFGTVDEVEEPDSTVGNDIGGFIIRAPVSSGGGSGAVTMTATAGGTTTNVRGPGFVLRARVAGVANQVYMPTSANITGGGEATTARLTAPSGKTTGDFTTGRRWDDENGTDSIDIAASDYTELERTLRFQSPAVNTDYFDFREYAGASALTSYTVTPRATVGAVVQAVAPSIELSGTRRNRAGRGPYSVGRYFRPSGNLVPAEVNGATVDLAGAAAASAQAGADLAIAKALAGSALAQSSSSAALNMLVGLAGAAAGAGTASGALAVAKQLAGAAAGQGAATGALAVSVLLNGAAVAGSSASGALSTSGSVDLAGAAQAGATATGALALTVSLLGASLSTSSSTGALDKAVGLGGGAGGGGAASGAVAHGVPIAGAAAGQGAATGALSKTVPLNGAAVAAGSATGLLDGGATLAGAAAGAGAATGQLAVSIALSGAALGSAQGSGTLSAALQLGGAAAAAAGASGLIMLSVPLAGQAQAIAQASGGLVVTLVLGGAAAGAGAGSGNLVKAVMFSGAAQATAFGSAVLTVGGIGLSANRALRARNTPRRFRARDSRPAFAAVGAPRRFAARATR